MGLYIIKADITTRDVDAIVCTSNENLKIGGILGNKILKIAGPQIKADLEKIGHCNVGNSVITKGYGLKARYVIHTVGPVYKDGKHNERKLLIKAYKSVLDLAVQKNLDSVEIPLISSGKYGYPNKEAVDIALSTISEFLKDNELSVGLVIYSNSTFNECQELFGSYPCYIGKGFVDKVKRSEYFDIVDRLDNSIFFPEDKISTCSFEPVRNKTFKTTGENFNATLIRYLNKTGKSNVEIYKKVGIDRRLFSKILSNSDYKPKKLTIFALILGMELDYIEASDLLSSAGYCFSKSILLDVIIEDFVKNDIHDMFLINDILQDNHQPLFACTE